MGLEERADAALFGTALLMREEVMRAAVELAERFPLLRASESGFPDSVEEFVAAFCREVGSVSVAECARFVSGMRAG